MSSKKPAPPSEVEIVAQADWVGKQTDWGQKQVGEQDVNESSANLANNEVPKPSQEQTIENDKQRSAESATADSECERLLRIAKKQVKQMMEEAVTKKVIHEESGSIISLCVAIDNCLSHGLKRRTLGLFKSNSSTALLQKIAKCCPSAQQVLQSVETEQRRLFEEEQQHQQQQLRKQSLAKQQLAELQAASALLVANGTSINSLARHQNQNQQQQQQLIKRASSPSSTHHLQSRNLHRRNLWLKCALIEKKLVDIVEFLAQNAPKYYESQALMASRVSAQLLCSLLVGPCALEFSRSKTSDYYLFEEPSADELLKRHKLSNPIACLCASSSGSSSSNNNNNNNGGISNVDDATVAHQAIGRSFSSSSGPTLQQQQQSTDQIFAANEMSLASTSQTEESRLTRANTAKATRRRPLALKSKLTSGTLITDCHHCSCKELSEHQHTRGYSFRSKSGASLTSASSASFSSASGAASVSARHQQQTTRRTPSPASLPAASGAAPHCLDELAADDDSLALWSPRMLHETLHQNSKSSLLYAKNNILLETAALGLMAGYLSLHQTASSDLIIKWIPNELINGGRTSCCGTRHAPTPSTASASGAMGFESVEQKDAAASGEQRSRSLDEQLRCACRQLGDASGATGTVCPSSVGSDYLDLVVSLSVARVVLLHCHFVANPCVEPATRLDPQRSSRQPADNANDSNHIHANSLEEGKRLEQSGSATPTSECQSSVTVSKDNVEVVSSATHDVKHDEGECDGHRDTNDDEESRSTPRPSMETLILVEADGVQRAPFRFPKGGLCAFLSCLETGLHPDRYLELAIKPEGWSDWPWAEEGPPAALPSGSETIDTTMATSRLNTLLRRLPSLKRTSARRADGPTSARSVATTTIANGALKTSSSSDSGAVFSCSRTGSPVANESCSRPASVTLRYVYRIVSIQQQHQADGGPQPTPPLSAFSITSSNSSSSFGSSAGVRWLRLVPNDQQSDWAACAAPSNQRFRWSLSRLTRFSTRRSGSASSAGSSSLATATAPAVSQTLSAYRSASNEVQQQQEADDDSVPSAPIKRDSSSELIRIEAKLDQLNSSSSSRDDLRVLRDQSLQQLCVSMRRQILARAFYGWLAHFRRTKIVRTHLLKLVQPVAVRSKSKQETSGEECRSSSMFQHHLLLDSALNTEQLELARRGLNEAKWRELNAHSPADESERNALAIAVSQLVYYGGIESDQLRAQVWPYLLGHYEFGDSAETRRAKDAKLREIYQSQALEWSKIERVIKQRDNEVLAANMARVERRRRLQQQQQQQQQQPQNDKNDGPDRRATEANRPLRRQLEWGHTSSSSSIGDWHDQDDDDQEADEQVSNEPDEQSVREEPNEAVEQDQQLDLDGHKTNETVANERGNRLQSRQQQQQQQQRKQRQQQARRARRRPRLESTGSLGSDASITDQFGNNIHRIDKDVQRCDRHFWYFKEAHNLDKLRNVMCSYVWQHLDVGYVQGMCDLAAPFLVIFNDEFQAYCCFNRLMYRMVANFPHGNAMDQYFESLKYLMQVLDPKLFEVLQKNGDYTHFYFCYRWLLLDFKRELAYADVYRVWETIWSARWLASDQFVLFLALAMVRYYRDIIIENNMDFTDTIKFFNEMAERHDVIKIIELAQDCVVELQSLIG